MSCLRNQRRRGAGAGGVRDSNVRPWIQAAERGGAAVRWIEIDNETTELDLDSFERALSPRTGLVAVTAASNVLGSKPPMRRIADQVHGVGALVYVDGVHYTAHHLVDVPALGVDLFVCSPYKFLGPHCGVLAGSPAFLDTAPSTGQCIVRSSTPNQPRKQVVTTRTSRISSRATSDRCAG